MRQIFGAVFEGPVKLTPVSAEFSKDATFEEMEEVTKIVAGWRKASPFHIGDILNEAEARGEKYSQLSVYFDLKPDTLMQYKWVMSKVPISNRIEILGFNYHVEVAKLSSNQKKWLEIAADKGWTIEEFRQQLTAEGLRKTVKRKVVPAEGWEGKDAGTLADPDEPIDLRTRDTIDEIGTCIACDKKGQRLKTVTIKICPSCTEKLEERSSHGKKARKTAEVSK